MAPVAFARSHQLRYVVPSAITLLRLAAAPVFYFVFLNCSCIIALVVFVLAALTDVLDGFIARKLDATSNAGAYLDAAVDFVLVMVVFIAFLHKGWYGRFVPSLILVLFICFIGSSGLKRPLYDPIGKYLGTFLMGMIVLSLLLPNHLLRLTLAIALTIFGTVSVVSRAVFLCRKS